MYRDTGFNAPLFLHKRFYTKTVKGLWRTVARAVRVRVDPVMVREASGERGLFAAVYVIRRRAR